MHACTLQAKVRALSATETYPEKPQAIQRIETHFAWVFLGDEHAYKLKRPMRIVDVDLSSLEARAFDCAEEVRLNRRLAPDVYLGVVPLTMGRDGSLRVDGDGEVVEWLVKMRRLPADLMLDRAIADRTVDPVRVRALGELLARFYAAQPRIDIEPKRYVQLIEQRIEDDRRDLLDPRLCLRSEAVELLAREQLRSLGVFRGELERRATQRRFVEAHGDLRPEHVCLSAPPCVIDCLEFSLHLRTLDALEELAFFHVECETLGAPWVADSVLQVYRNLSNDAFTRSLFDFYRSRRAAIRAKLLAWHLLDSAVRDLAPWSSLADTYIRRAIEYVRAYG